VGTLAGFQAVFRGSFDVYAGSRVNFNFFSDDGWILSIGPNASGGQPTYVSGPMINPPDAGAFSGFPIVGSYNTGSPPTQNDLVIDFPAPGSYPFELNYTEGYYGQLALTLKANNYPLTQAGINVFIGHVFKGNYFLRTAQSTRQSYAGVNSGPVRIVDTDNIPMLAAERVIYKAYGVNRSFSEMMGLPNSQIGTTYWLPWYNNTDLDTQLRIANVSNSMASVRVYIGSVEMNGSPFTLAVGASTRKSFPDVNNGPVRIVSNQNIIASERLIYTVNEINTSFSEMMALPESQFDTTYWLPWYNNVDLDTQLRIANVSAATATVHVYVGSVEMQGSPFTLETGISTRKSFAGVNNGPVKIVSNQKIVAAERVIYKVNNTNTSFTEMMALPDSQLDTTYWLPWYNNSGDLDTQLRIANVSGSTANVHIYIGSVEMTGSPFTIAAGASTRKNFAGVNNGPVRIVSNQNIVAAERMIYKVNGINTSFSELMGLPNGQLDTSYWLPWYNNVDLDTQLRFGVP